MSCGKNPPRLAPVESCRHLPTTPLLLAKPLERFTGFELSSSADSPVLALRITISVFTWNSCRSCLSMYDTPVARPLAPVSTSRTTALVVTFRLLVFGAGVTRHGENEESAVDLAAAPALPAEKAGPPVFVAGQDLRQHRAPAGYHLHARFSSALLDEQFVELGLGRRQRDAARLIFQALHRNIHSDEAAYFIMKRLDLVVSNGPIIRQAVNLVAFEARGTCAGKCPPVVGAAAQHVDAEPVSSVLSLMVHGSPSSSQPPYAASNSPIARVVDAPLRSDSCENFSCSASLTRSRNGPSSSISTFRPACVST